MDVDVPPRPGLGLTTEMLLMVSRTPIEAMPLKKVFSKPRRYR